MTSMRSNGIGTNWKPKLLTSAHPQTASFDPERRFRSFEILDVARYASGLKIAQALLWTKIYHLWTDTNLTMNNAGNQRKP